MLCVREITRSAGAQYRCKAIKLTGAVLIQMPSANGSSGPASVSMLEVNT